MLDSCNTSPRFAIVVLKIRKLVKLAVITEIIQGQYESLGDYKKRVLLAVEALDAIEHPNIPAEGARVSHFVESLNCSYNEWKRNLMNGIRKGRGDSSLSTGILLHPY